MPPFFFPKPPDDSPKWLLWVYFWAALGFAILMGAPLVMSLLRGEPLLP